MGETGVLAVAEMNSEGGNGSSLPGQARIREPNLPWVSSKSSQSPEWQPLLTHALGWESTWVSPSELEGLTALPGWHSVTWGVLFYPKASLPPWDFLLVLTQDSLLLLAWWSAAQLLDPTNWGAVLAPKQSQLSWLQS